MVKKWLSSKLTGKRPKMKIYITTVRPIVAYMYCCSLYVSLLGGLCTCALSASISFLEIGRIHRMPNQGSTVGGG
jgi:hypothetical protein